MDSIIRYIIGNNMVKYEHLDKMFSDIHIEPDTVTWHIDAWHLFMRCFRDKESHAFTTTPEAVLVRNIVVSVVNIIAHYRRYTALKLHKNSKFLIYFNQVSPIYQTKFYSDYKKDIYNLFKDDHKDYAIVNRVIGLSLNMLYNIMPRIEGAYWIFNTGIDTPTAISYVMKTKKYKSDFHILFLRDVLTLQLLSDNCIQFYQKKKEGSYLITTKSLIQNGFKKPDKLGVENTLPSKFIIFHFAMNGCSDVASKRIKVGTVDGLFRKLSKLYEEKEINEKSSIDTVIQKLSESNKEYKKRINENIELIKTRYKMYNLDLSARSISDTHIQHMFHAHFDLYDQEALEDLNQMLVEIDEKNEIIHLESLNMVGDDYI